MKRFISQNFLDVISYFFLEFNDVVWFTQIMTETKPLHFLFVFQKLLYWWGHVTEGITSLNYFHTIRFLWNSDSEGLSSNPNGEKHFYSQKWRFASDSVTLTPVLPQNVNYYAGPLEGLFQRRCIFNMMSRILELESWFALLLAWTPRMNVNSSIPRNRLSQRYVHSLVLCREHLHPWLQLRITVSLKKGWFRKQPFQELTYAY
jgi:hypothetical protein